MSSGHGFRVWGLGFGVWGLGERVADSAFQDLNAPRSASILW